MKRSWRAWGIVQSGQKRLYGLGLTRDDAKNDLAMSGEVPWPWESWTRLEEQGFRIIRVKVEEE